MNLDSAVITAWRESAGTPFLRHGRAALGTAGLLGLAACAAPPAPPVSAAHLLSPPAVEGKAPDFVLTPPLPKPSRPAPRQEVYSVVMQNVNVQELLFALARDARLNVDIHPAITGTVTMNVRDQTLPEILDRVARQVDLRYEMQGNNLSILPDTPYLKNYRIDYPNIQRDASVAISTSTNMASLGTGSGSNASSSEISSKGNNRFWDTLVGNVRDMLRETDKQVPITLAAAPAAAPIPAPAGTAPRPNVTAVTNATPDTPAGLVNVASAPGRSQFREASSVMSNPESGYLSVRASQRQHERVAEFLERVMRSARRQVLIEATIVEVDLSSRYQQGIDWSLLKPDGTAFDASFTVRPSGPSSGLQTGGTLSSLTSLTLTGASLFKGYDLTGILSMLESFGTLRVLSSPKISVLNNQSSVLKVVDNKVYFVVSVTAGTPGTANTAATPATYSTTINTVPIGLLMTVTPQISETNEVILSLRPTISRITGYANDPNPVLAQNTIVNRIPEVQTREMESVLRVQSGGVAILGGLMQDSRNNASDEVPLLNQLPVLGNLFKFRDEASKKTELVIFLRPTVLQDPSLDGDFRAYRDVVQQTREAMDAPVGPNRPEFQFPQARP
ncbi:MAG: pilus (MSHA type) biogenesis protein MshL [Rhodoferax sp.]|nr:pilus (MSHA type) biogenesis protein MshL [Rhodoferax sp.]